MNVLATYLLITMYNNFVGWIIVDSVSISYIVVNGIRVCSVSGEVKFHTFIFNNSFFELFVGHF